MDGILNLYKPAGISSHGAVSRVRRIFGMKRVGHAGTLDPMACGVLPMMLGEATKLSEFMLAHDKGYTAGLRLGKTTDTQDTTGELLSESDDIPGPEEVAAAAARFAGKIEQIPPMHSAIKMGGVKLYQLARAGKSVERAPRKVEIYSIAVTPGESVRDYILDVRCSKGTYIRTLCADIGAALGCGGVMASLERTQCGPFRAENAVRLDELENLGEDALAHHLMSIGEYLEGRFGPGIALDERRYTRVFNGLEAELDSDAAGEFVPLYSHEGQLFALARIRREGGAVYAKAVRRVNL